MADTRTRRKSAAAGELVVGKDQTASVRLAAIAALHQPINRHYPGTSVQGHVLEPAVDVAVCGECKTTGRSYGDGLVPVRWPCSTARLVAAWPMVEGDGRG